MDNWNNTHYYCCKIELEGYLIDKDNLLTKEKCPSPNVSVFQKFNSNNISLEQCMYQAVYEMNSYNIIVEKLRCSLSNYRMYY